MLRFDHLPSDFNPLFLFLGDSQDLASLAGLLRSFAGHPRTLTLHEQLPGSRSRTSLELRHAEGESENFGLRPDGRGGFSWGLNVWQAEQIAERIDAVAHPDNRSGSEIIELGVEGEIPVKVSRGEFTEDFLVRRF